VNTEHIITLCDGTACIQRGAHRIRDRLIKEIDARGLTDRVRISLSGCLGICGKGPVMVVNPGYTIYGNLTEDDIPEIVEQHLLQEKPIARLAVQEDHLFNRFFRIFGDSRFFGHQMRIALRNVGIIDPENIDDYLSLRGYEAVARMLTEMTPKDVIEEVKRSGLRGRGGAGFPTWRKWQFCRDAPGRQKYLVCNADEGDPGAFMNRSLLEGDPHTIV